MNKPKFHALIYHVKGLNMGTEKFIWNDKLLFTDAGAEDGNIAEARVLIDRPMPEVSDDHGHFNSEREGILILSLFLACFRIINKNLDLTISRPIFSGHSVYDMEDFKKNDEPILFNDLYTDLPKHPEEYCKKYLLDTIHYLKKL